MKKEKLNIIFEDKYILVIDKPAGLLTIATTKEKEKTLFHQALLYEKKKHKSNKIFIVHRLDYDTSGIIIFSKSIEVKEYFQNNWDNIVLLREYIGVVEGKVLTEKDTIISYIKENKFLKSYSTTDQTGKKAITEYSVINKSKGYTLLKIIIKSGRKNQVRVHMSDMGHPLLGDKKYGALTNPLRRVGLHAHKIIFLHPHTKEKVELISPIPDEFTKMFKGGNYEKNLESSS